MKILFVHNKYLQSAGGEDTSVATEIQLLAERGHTVEVLYFNNADFEGSLLLKIRAGLRSVHNVQAKQVLKKVIQSFQPDIIHVHNFYFQASPSVFDAAYESQVPVVFTVHNFRLICVNALLLREHKVCESCVHSFLAWKGILHKCYHDSLKESAVVALIAAFHKAKQTWTKKINRIITPSEFLRDKLLHSSLHLDKDKVVVKRNFITDPGIGRPAERDNYYLFVGRLSEEKGIKFLLELFSGLDNEKLFIAGDGPQKDELINAYSKYPNIVFLGKKDRGDVLHLLKHCRALLFPSIWYEGLPMTIIEAFATGTPVISTNLGGMAEMIIPNVNGLLFEKEDRKALIGAIQAVNKMVNEKNTSLYTGARETYITQYTPEKCYTDILNIYSSVISESKAKSTH